MPVSIETTEYGYTVGAKTFTVDASKLPANVLAAALEQGLGYFLKMGTSGKDKPDAEKAAKAAENVKRMQAGTVRSRGGSDGVTNKRYVLLILRTAIADKNTKLHARFAEYDAQESYNDKQKFLIGVYKSLAEAQRAAVDERAAELAQESATQGLGL